MVEDKVTYYTPEIEDLFIGYECQIHHNIIDPESGLVRVSEEWGDYSIYSFQEGNNIELIRTKYLDKQDIEDLGWSPIESGFFASTFKDFKLNIHWLGLNSPHIYTIEDKFGIIYKGNIFSKNELKKLMKMLNI